MGSLLAAGDIGSNTAHILVAEVDCGNVRRISDANEWLSLGEIVGREGRIPPDAIKRLVRALGAFQRLARLQRASRIYLFATEAMRSAQNGAEVLAHIRRQTGLKIELISGTQEAVLGLRGAWIDCAGPLPCLFAEMGGGSTQIAWCEPPGKPAPSIRQEVSLRLGTGSLTARCTLDSPASKESVTRLKREISRVLRDQPLANSGPIIACGGVARGLWRTLHPDGERRIFRQELDYLMWAASQLDEAGLVRRFGIKPKRAHTLLPGAAVFAALLDRSGCESFLVSSFGVREGAVLMMAEGSLKGQAVKG